MIIVIITTENPSTCASPLLKRPARFSCIVATSFILLQEHICLFPAWWCIISISFYTTGCSSPGFKLVIQMNTGDSQHSLLTHLGICVNTQSNILHLNLHLSSPESSPWQILDETFSCPANPPPCLGCFGSSCFQSPPGAGGSKW